MIKIDELSWAKWFSHSIEAGWLEILHTIAAREGASRKVAAATLLLAENIPFAGARAKDSCECLNLNADLTDTIKALKGYYGTWLIVILVSV